MKIGAIISSSIYLIDEIIKKKKITNLQLSYYLKNNKFIGSKDRKILYEIVYNTLKKYHTLSYICKINNITAKYSNNKANRNNNGHACCSCR